VLVSSIIIDKFANLRTGTLNALWNHELVKKNVCLVSDRHGTCWELLSKVGQDFLLREFKTDRVVVDPEPEEPYTLLATSAEGRTFGQLFESDESDEYINFIFGEAEDPGPNDSFPDVEIDEDFDYLDLDINISTVKVNDIAYFPYTRKKTFFETKESKKNSPQPVEAKASFVHTMVTNSAGNLQVLEAGVMLTPEYIIQNGLISASFIRTFEPGVTITIEYPNNINFVTEAHIPPAKYKENPKKKPSVQPLKKKKFKEETYDDEQENFS